MSYIVVDVEADGPIPCKYSMVCFGAVVVDNQLNRSFYGKLSPISPNFIQEALSISGFTREEHLKFDNPLYVMQSFKDWIYSNSRGNPIFISDNLAFDWQWINYYFHTYLSHNPFGFSGRRIGDLYCGMKMDSNVNRDWKRLYRKTKHSHNPVDDAKGNAEALLAMKRLGLKINFQ